MTSDFIIIYMDEDGISHIWFCLCYYGCVWQSIEMIFNTINMVDYGSVWICLIIFFMENYRTNFIDDLYGCNRSDH